MRPQQRSLLISTLMVAASIGAIAARPDISAAVPEPALSLEAMIPRRLGDWHEEHFELVVNPLERKLLNKLYSDTLSRAYMNSSGYMIMLSLAHGRDQRAGLEAHMPEYCYPANGFTLHRNELGQIRTPFGEVSVRRLLASKGAREESITYWFTLAGESSTPLYQAGQRFRRRLVDLRFAFTGRIPDGVLLRVSSIDHDQNRANQMQEEFVKDLLSALSPPERKRLSGL